MPLTVYALTIMIQVLIITFFGQIYINKYEKLPDYLYELPWYMFDHSAAKSLNIMQNNVMKPNKLTAAKLFILNLPTFMIVSL